MGFNTSGFDELGQELESLANRAEELDGRNEVSLSELLPQSFMLRFTEFSSIEEFFEESPWEIETEEDFEAIHEDDLDGYVEANTKFEDWETMQEEAMERWVADKLELGR